jgi:transposase
MTAKEALRLYKSRDGSEKLFRGDKFYLGNRSARSHTNESFNAKVFIEFVALIIRNKIYTRKELEKIELIKQFNGNYVLDHAVTARQKAILKSFGKDAKCFIKDIHVL